MPNNDYLNGNDNAKLGMIGIVNICKNAFYLLERRAQKAIHIIVNYMDDRKYKRSRTFDTHNANAVSQHNASAGKQAYRGKVCTFIWKHRI